MCVLFIAEMPTLQHENLYFMEPVGYLSWHDGGNRAGSELVSRSLFCFPAPWRSPGEFPSPSDARQGTASRLLLATQALGTGRGSPLPTHSAPKCVPSRRRFTACMCGILTVRHWSLKLPPLSHSYFPRIRLHSPHVALLTLSYPSSA